MNPEDEMFDIPTGLDIPSDDEIDEDGSAAGFDNFDDKIEEATSSADIEMPAIEEKEIEEPIYEETTAEEEAEIVSNDVAESIVPEMPELAVAEAMSVPEEAPAEVEETVVPEMPEPAVAEAMSVPEETPAVVEEPVVPEMPELAVAEPMTVSEPAPAEVVQPVVPEISEPAVAEPMTIPEPAPAVVLEPVVPETPEQAVAEPMSVPEGVPAEAVQPAIPEIPEQPVAQVAVAPQVVQDNSLQPMSLTQNADPSLQPVSLNQNVSQNYPPDSVDIELKQPSNDKKKKGSKKGLIIIVLIVLIVAIAGYVAYDLFIKPKKTTSTNVEQKELSYYRLKGEEDFSSIYDITSSELSAKTEIEEATLEVKDGSIIYVKDDSNYTIKLSDVVIKSVGYITKTNEKYIISFSDDKKNYYYASIPKFDQDIELSKEENDLIIIENQNNIEFMGVGTDPFTKELFYMVTKEITAGAETNIEDYYVLLKEGKYVLEDLSLHVYDGLMFQFSSIDLSKEVKEKLQIDGIGIKKGNLYMLQGSLDKLSEITVSDPSGFMYYSDEVMVVYNPQKETLELFIFYEDAGSEYLDVINLLDVDTSGENINIIQYEDSIDKKEFNKEGAPSEIRITFSNGQVLNIK